MRGPLFAAILTVSFAAAGCVSDATALRTWVATQGGTIVDARLARATKLSKQLLANRTDLSIQLAVLARGDLSAYSWPDGKIFLSRGLIDALNDEQLTAAIAHETGHVLDRRAAPMAAGLRGGDQGFAAEIRADQQGVDLLSSRGISADAMISLLQRMEREPLASSTRRDLRRRVELLAANCGTCRAITSGNSPAD